MLLPLLYNHFNFAFPGLRPGNKRPTIDINPDTILGFNLTV
jgi:hypothetical protein